MNKILRLFEDSLYFSIALKYRSPLSLLALLGCIQTGVTLLIPLLLSTFLSEVLTGYSPSLVATCAVILSFLLLLAFLSVVIGFMSAATGARILADLRSTVHQHVLRLPMSRHDQADRGETLSLMTFEIESLSSFLTTTLAGGVPLVLTAIGSLGAMFILDSALAIGVPLVLCVIIVVARLVGRRIRQLAHLRRRSEVNIVSQVDRDLSIIQAIKIYNRERDQRFTYHRLLEVAVDRSRHLASWNSAFGPAVGFVVSAAAVAILAFASSKLEAGALSTRDLVSFLLYAALLTRPLIGLADAFGSFRSSQGALHALKSLMSQSIEDDLGRLSLPLSAPSIKFDGVHFGYRGRESILEDFNLQVRPGEIVAITGPNGSGKSTLGSLLLRLYDIQAGEIYLGGVRINDIPLAHLRELVGIAPQHAQLFDATIRENILFGNPRANERQFHTALELSGTCLFLNQLPHGLDTRVGAGGALLSGGQRQRVTLARALISDPKILILDEATSMMDISSEVTLVADLAEAVRGKTVLLITHRPEMLSLADREIRMG